MTQPHTDRRPLRELARIGELTAHSPGNRSRCTARRPAKRRSHPRRHVEVSTRSRRRDARHPGPPRIGPSPRRPRTQRPPVHTHPRQARVRHRPRQRRCGTSTHELAVRPTRGPGASCVPKRSGTSSRVMLPRCRSWAPDIVPAKAQCPDGTPHRTWSNPAAATEHCSPRRPVGDPLPDAVGVDELGRSQAAAAVRSPFGYRARRIDGRRDGPMAGNE